MKELKKELKEEKKTIAVLSIGCNIIRNLPELSYAEKDASFLFNQTQKYQNIDSYKIVGINELNETNLNMIFEKIESKSYELLIIYYSGHGNIRCKDGKYIRVIPLQHFDNYYDIESRILNSSITKILFIYDACCSIKTPVNEYDFLLDTAEYPKKIFWISKSPGETTYESRIKRSSIIIYNLKKNLFSIFPKKITTHELGAKLSRQKFITNGRNFPLVLIPKKGISIRNLIKLILLLFTLFLGILIFSWNSLLFVPNKNGHLEKIKYGAFYQYEVNGPFTITLTSPFITGKQLKNIIHNSDLINELNYYLLHNDLNDLFTYDLYQLFKEHYENKESFSKTFVEAAIKYIQDNFDELFFSFENRNFLITNCKYLNIIPLFETEHFSIMQKDELLNFALCAGVNQHIIDNLDSFTIKDKMRLVYSNKEQMQKDDFPYFKMLEPTIHEFTNLIINENLTFHDYPYEYYFLIDAVSKNDMKQIIHYLFNKNILSELRYLFRDLSDISQLYFLEQINEHFPDNIELSSFNYGLYLDFYELKSYELMNYILYDFYPNYPAESIIENTINSLERHYEYYNKNIGIHQWLNSITTYDLLIKNCINNFELTLLLLKLENKEISRAVFKKHNSFFISVFATFTSYIKSLYEYDESLYQYFKNLAFEKNDPYYYVNFIDFEFFELKNNNYRDELIKTLSNYPEYALEFVTHADEYYKFLKQNNLLTMIKKIIFSSGISKTEVGLFALANWLEESLDYLNDNNLYENKNFISALCTSLRYSKNMDIETVAYILKKINENISFESAEIIKNLNTQHLIKTGQLSDYELFFDSNYRVTTFIWFKPLFNEFLYLLNPKKQFTKEFKNFLITQTLTTTELKMIVNFYNSKSKSNFKKIMYNDIYIRLKKEGAL